MREDYIKAVKQTELFAAKSGISHRMVYSPTSERFWSQPIRLLCVNWEPYGYENDREVSVSKDVLTNWMFDAERKGKKGSKTVRYSIACLKVIRDGYRKAQVPSLSSFSEAYHDRDGLLRVLDEVCYYNIRSTSNSVKNERHGMASQEERSLVSYISDEIRSLDADFVLASGRNTASLLGTMLSLNKKVSPPSVQEFGNQVIACVKHFSRPSYPALLKMSLEAIPLLLQKNQRASLRLK